MKIIFLTILIIFASCLSQEGEDGPILEFDVRTEQSDEKPPYSLIVRLKISDQMLAADPNQVVAKVQFPNGTAWELKNSDWNPDLNRYERVESYFFPELIVSGTYQAEAFGETVQDTLHRNFLDLPTLQMPVYGAKVGCTPLLAWAPVSHAAKYQVLIRKRPERDTILSDTITENQFTIPEGILHNDTVYEWKIFVFDRTPEGDVDNQSKSKFSRFLVLGQC